MKRSKRMDLIIVITVLVIIFAVGLVLLYLTDFGAGIRYLITEIKMSQQLRVRLLCETDHQALLEACRDISRMVAKGDLKKYEYSIRRNPDPDPETSRFSQVILDLEPSRIYIDEDGRVMVEMFGGLDPFGVYAYPEDYTLPSYSKYGDKKLIDGLWYYDGEYREHPEYEKRIEALMQKGKMKKQDKQDSEE